MFHAAHRAVRAAFGVSTLAVAVASAPSIQAQKAPAPGQASAGQAPNLGEASNNVDITELNREAQQTGERRRER